MKTIKMRKMMKVFFAFLVLAFMAAIVTAAPYGPRSVDVLGNDRRTEFNESVSSIQAQAGNVSLLMVNTSTLTGRWQGYYGNISGIVTLQSANGFRMYEWGNGVGISVAGEVYASNNTVGDWTRVLCVNLTGNSTNTSTYGPNATIIEAMYGAGISDIDGVDETFTGIEEITVGNSNLINCPTAMLYNGSGSVNALNWNVTLLYENSTAIETTRSIIYGAIIQNNENSFNNKTTDFQMIVGENGGISAATTYYFYVELT